MSDFTTTLISALGSDHVSENPADFAPKLIDNRRRYTGSVTCAVFPSSTEEVSKVMRIAHDFNAYVFVQGGNTSNVAGATPISPQKDVPSVLICTDRMRKIEAIDTINNTAVVQAGVIVEDLQNAASEQDRLFAVSLAAQGSCTVAGLLASNAGGVHVLHYGNSREQCLGLEVVLADGRILNLLRGLRKDNTGYDLKHLFIGSEGTLGIITRAVMKLWPKPKSRTVLFLSIAETGGLSQTFEAFSRTLSGSMTAFEVMHVDTIRHVQKVWPEIVQGISLSDDWYALIELSFLENQDADALSDQLENVISPLFEAGVITDAVVAQNESQNNALWRIRESIPEAHKATGGNVKHDISIPRSVLGEFVDSTNAALKKKFDWIAPSVFGHFGDGNLHYNMGVVCGRDPQLCFEHEEEIHAVVYEAVARYQGSVAAEHGIGRMKKSLLKEVKSDVEYSVMQAVKSVFDPAGRLNPGAVIDPATQISFGVSVCESDQ